MSKWFCTLLVACATAHAAPGSAPSDDMDKLLADKGLLNQLVEIRHNVAEKAQDKLSQVGQNVANRAHDVVDRTSDLVVTAMGFLGVPYRRGGNSAESGFDCSGFVRAMYQQTVGLMLPRRADQQAASTQVIDKKELQPGDLVFFNTGRRTQHVGIFIEDGQFLHASTSKGVIISDLDNPYWRKTYWQSRRLGE